MIVAESELTQCYGSMYAAVIEFDTLTDTVRTAAEDHNLLFVGIDRAFVLCIMIARSNSMRSPSVPLTWTPSHALPQRQAADPACHGSASSGIHPAIWLKYLSEKPSSFACDKHQHLPEPVRDRQATSFSSSSTSSFICSIK